MPETTPRALVLGPTRLRLAGVPRDLTPIQRRLVARLAATPGRSVPLDDLFASLWDGSPPATARAAVQNQISRLRALAGRDVIATDADGYRLTLATDAEALRATVRHAERVIVTDPGQTLVLVERALALVTGPPFADLFPASLAAGPREEVEGLLDAAADHEVEAALALGLTGHALPAARRLAAQAPCDERRALRLARALDQVSRRGEALAEIARVRRALRVELGLDGSAELDAVEAAILGADAPVTGVASPAEIDRALAALDAGRAVAVSGDVGAAVTDLLVATRDRLLARGGGPVAMTEVRGYRDVAVAALLDLLDALGVASLPELGPVGTFVPAVARLAEQRPVVLIVDGFDLAGPSTRRVLLEAARHERIALLAGFRGTTTAEFETVIALTTDEHDHGARRAVLRRRLAELGPELRETLAVVAVAGDGVRVDALRALGVADGLPGALARALLLSTSSGTISFADGELRALMLADMPAGIRDERHHALGHVLVELGAIEDAARHLLAAAEIEPGAAVQAARAAAASAAASGAHHDAVAWLSQAADRCRDARTRIAVAIELGDALRLAGDASHVSVLLAAAEQAMARGDEELLGEAVFALLQLGGTTVNTGVDPVVSRLLDQTLDRLRDEHQLALVRGAASLAFSMTGAAERSRSLFVAAERGAVDPLTRRRVLPFAYMALGTPGDLDRRRRHADELLELAAEHDDPVAAFEGLHLAASVQMQDADGAALRRTHHELAALVDRVGDVGRRWALHYLAAAIAQLDGDGPRVEALSSAAFAQFAPVSESRATAVLFGQLFGLRLTQGRVGELRPVLETLVEGQPGVPAWNAALALGTVDDDPHRAATLATRALDLAQPDLTWLAAHLVAARAVALAGRRGVDVAVVAERCRGLLEPWSGRVSWQGTCSYGPVDTTLALLADLRGDTAGARAFTTAALGQADRLGAPSFGAELRRLGLAG